VTLDTVFALCTIKQGETYSLKMRVISFVASFFLSKKYFGFLVLLDIKICKKQNKENHKGLFGFMN